MVKQCSLILLCILFVLSSLYSKGKYDFNENKMQTLGGETVDISKREDIYVSKDLGYGFVLTSGMLSMQEGRNLEISSVSPYQTVFTAYSNGMSDLFESIDVSKSTPEEREVLNNEAKKYIFELATILRIDNKVNHDLVVQELESLYENVQKIAETDENTYYLSYNDNFSHLSLREGEDAKFHSLVNDIKSFKNNIFVFNPEEIKDKEIYSFSSFEVTTLDGQIVTQDIFNDYEITMINVWASWCDPCIEEMPDLARLHKKMLPENVNMFTILTDVPDGVDIARDVVTTSEGEFSTLLFNDSLSGMFSIVYTLPTTLMVDSKGNIVGKPIIGAPPTNPAEYYLEAIESALLEVKRELN